MIDTNKRLVWADVVRLAALFMMICVHCTDPFNVSPEARVNPEYSLWGSLYGSFLRPCVPLFAMLTGVLLLPVRESMGQFYRKRMLRVLVPFLIWSLAYNLFPWFTGLMGWDSSVLSFMFPYAGESPSQTFSASLHDILLIPFTFSTYTVPLWYIYMLLGLYLVMPVLSAWLQVATRRQIRFILGVWVVSLLVPYCREWLSGYAVGECAWNEFGIFYYVSGFCGYLLLGYYLRDLPTEGRTLRLVSASLLMLSAGFAATYFGFRYMAAQSNATEEQVELFFLYCSPQVMLMTAAWFLLLRRIRVSSRWIRSALADMSRCGLGIYMIHYLLVGLGFYIVDWLGLPVCLRIPASALIVFCGAWGVVSAMHRCLPKVARWVMG